VEEAIAMAEHVRESKWTESVAVGSRSFVETVKAKLGVRAKRRRFSGTDDEATLRESQSGYSLTDPFGRALAAGKLLRCHSSKFMPIMLPKLRYIDSRSN
jgi:hypothetical protein